MHEHPPLVKMYTPAFDDRWRVWQQMQEMLSEKGVGIVQVNVIRFLNDTWI